MEKMIEFSNRMSEINESLASSARIVGESLNKIGKGFKEASVKLSHTTKEIDEILKKSSLNLSEIADKIERLPLIEDIEQAMENNVLLIISKTGMSRDELMDMSIEELFELVEKLEGNSK